MIAVLTRCLSRLIQFPCKIHPVIKAAVLLILYFPAALVPSLLVDHQEYTGELAEIHFPIQSFGTKPVCFECRAVCMLCKDGLIINPSFSFQNPDEGVSAKFVTLEIPSHAALYPSAGIGGGVFTLLELSLFIA